MPSLARASSPSAAGSGRAHRPHRRDVIGKSGAANEALGRLTPEVVDKLHEQRMFRLLLPRVYGGDEVDLATWFRAMEALAKLDASTAWCVGGIGTAAREQRALPRSGDSAQNVERTPLGVERGPPVKSARRRGRGRPPPHRRVDDVERQPARDLDRPGDAHLRPGRRADPASRTDHHAYLLGARRRLRVVDNWDIIGLTATNSGGFKAPTRSCPRATRYCCRILLGPSPDSRSTSFPSTPSSPSAFRPSRWGQRARMLAAIASRCPIEKKTASAKIALALKEHDGAVQVR